MTLRYHYTKTALNKIGSALGGFFSGLESQDKNFSRAVNFNLLIPLSSPELLDSLESELDAFSLVHPARFFVLYFDPTLTAVEASVTARCHALSKSDHVCSEIIRIGCPPGQTQAMASVVRGNLLTGLATELYLFDPRIGIETLQALAPLGDTIILDSGEFTGHLETLDVLTRLVRSVLDLQWVGLGLWRDEVKDLFSRPVIRDYLEKIQSVEITASCDQAHASGASSFLFAAWVIERLGFTSDLSYGRGGFECTNGNGKRLRVAINGEGASATPQLQSVRFRFDPLEFEGTQQEQFVQLTRGDGLETMVDLTLSYRSRRPFDDETREGRIKRYFLIGESVTNYTAAARLALELERLRLGYAV